MPDPRPEQSVDPLEDSVRSSGGGGPLSARLRWLLRIAVLIPIGVAVIRALATGWIPVGDDALLAVRAFDVGTRYHPLLGSWTSASLALGIPVNNPGALYLDLCAPLMWTVGRWWGIAPATALAIGAVNAAAALGIILTGSRIGGWRIERWMLLLVVALGWSMGSELLYDIWQPHALLLPFCLLLMLTVGVASGDVRLLPLWIGVASLVVQTHLAYVYVVAALAALVVVTLLARWRRVRSSVRAVVSSVPARLAVLVTAVAWAQPVWEQWFGQGQGNLARLATHAGGGELTVGASTATRIVAAVTALPPWWMRFGWETSVRSTPLTQTVDGPRLFVPDLPAGWLAVVSLLVLLGALGWLVAVLSGESQRPARMAAVVALLGLLVALAGLTIQTVTITGLGNHQVRWLFALSVYVHVTIARGLIESWTARSGGTSVARTPGTSTVTVDRVVLAGCAVLTIANLPFHANDLGPVADRKAADTLERTFEDLTGFAPGGPVQFDTDNIRVFEPYSSAVLLRLRELGIDFRFEDEITVRQFGEARRVDGSEVGHVRQLERSDALLFTGDGCLLSRRSGVAADIERIADQLIAAASADLASGRYAVDVAGLPEDVRLPVEAAVAGDAEAAFRVVADALMPVLVNEGRVDATPAMRAAAEQNDTIVARVNSTLAVVATPATLCDR